jgi:hypothetical protein
MFSAIFPATGSRMMIFLALAVERLLNDAGYVIR